MVASYWHLWQRMGDVIGIGFESHRLPPAPDFLQLLYQIYNLCLMVGYIDIQARNLSEQVSKDQFLIWSRSGAGAILK